MSAIYWAPASLDRIAVALILGKVPDEDAWLLLTEMAGIHIATAAVADGEVKFADVEKRLSSTLKVIDMLITQLDQPIGKAVDMQMNLVNTFSLKDPSAAADCNVQHLPLGYMHTLVTISDQMKFVLSSMREKHASSIGQSHRSSWNSLVISLHEWCEAQDLSTNYHARSEAAGIPPFRRLLNYLDGLLPDSHQQQFQTTEAEVRAIERALRKR